MTDNELGTLAVPEIAGATVGFGMAFGEPARSLGADELAGPGAAFAGTIGVSPPNTNTLAITRAVSPKRFNWLRSVRHLQLSRDSTLNDTNSLMNGRPG